MQDQTTCKATRLRITRKTLTPQVLVVLDEDLPTENGQVIARYNETHDILTLTKHGKGRRAEIKNALAKTASV
jgi:hypothetical protein